MKRLIALCLLSMFLLTSCSLVMMRPVTTGSSDDSDISSEERDRSRRKDRDEDRSEPDESDPDGSKLSDFLTGLISGGGNSASGGSAAGSAAQEPGTPSGGGSYELFAQLPESFYFSSGAGGWGTALSIYPDGSFAASYHDSDMGDTGDGYPGGKVYYNNCIGTLSSPVQINDYTWSVYVKDMTLEGTPGESHIEDEILWICSELYGLDDVEEILIYLPSAPVDQLPEEFKDWVYWDLSSESGDTLNFYGLYNVNGQQGYSGRIY